MPRPKFTMDQAFAKQPGANAPTLDNWMGAAGKYFGGAAGDTAAPAAPTAGTQSGPGILENWFNQRANGTDPGWEYGMGRASDQINRQYAARGGYNSSAATQSLSDMYSNSVSQREGQLDQLAGGASGEHQRRLEDMFSEGLGIAGGEAGVAGAYDQSAGGAMQSGQRAKLELMLSKAGVDQKTAQAELDAIFGVAKIGAGAGGKASTAGATGAV